MQSKQVYVNPLSGSLPINITSQLKRIVNSSNKSLEICGVQYDSEQDVDRSLLLSIYSFANLFHFAFPNPARTKNTIKKELRDRQKIKVTADKSNIQIQYKGNFWKIDKRSNQLEPTDGKVYLNRVYPAEVIQHPGLSAITIGEDSFNTQEPVTMIDSNEWAFAVGGKYSVEIFSNGRRFLHQITPLKLRFGPGGLYVITASLNVQNIPYQRYSQLTYSKVKLNNNIKIQSPLFDLVGCGKVMFLIESDRNTYVRLTPISHNCIGTSEIALDSAERNVLGFGGFSLNEQVVVVYMVSSIFEELEYEEFRFSVNVK